MHKYLCTHSAYEWILSRLMALRIYSYYCYRSTVVIVCCSDHTHHTSLDVRGTIGIKQQHTTHLQLIIHHQTF